MSNYKTLVNIRFNQGDITLNQRLVGRYSQRQQQELAVGICGIISVEWLSLLCFSGMSLCAAVERLSNDVKLKKQSIRNVVYHNEKIFSGNDRDFTELFDDIYNRFIYSNLHSNISNSNTLLDKVNLALRESSYVVLVLHLRNGEEHMVAVGRSWGRTGIFDPNVGLINLSDNIAFYGFILNEMFQYYDINVVDVDILRRTPLIPAPHTVIRNN
ncbi:hypothetical protein IRP70_004890 [Salmonella enterica]|nr:hypothetical protein [Salmonella enterica]EGM2983897.1 hypothetical protein [Salmonella enterica]